jgi:hypothetical protein
MNEIVKMVAAKTGMSESVAKMAVDVVVSQLKKKLPASVGSQIESLLGDGGSSKSSNPLGGLTDKLGGFLGKK